MRDNVRPSPFTTNHSEIVWSSPWFEVRQDHVRLPDGNQGVFNVIQHKGAVWIIPVTATGQIVLLNHYRYSVDDWCWEIPAGGIKDGHSLEETVLAELSEEIGGAAESIEAAGQFYTSNGITNEVAHVYIASGVILGETNHEPAEVMELHLKSLEDVLNMARSGQISDGPSALAILLNENRLRELTEIV